MLWRRWGANGEKGATVPSSTIALRRRQCNDPSTTTSNCVMVWLGVPITCIVLRGYNRLHCKLDVLVILVQLEKHTLFLEMIKHPKVQSVTSWSLQKSSAQIVASVILMGVGLLLGIYATWGRPGGWRRGMVPIARIWMDMADECGLMFEYHFNHLVVVNDHLIVRISILHILEMQAGITFFEASNLEITPEISRCHGVSVAALPRCLYRPRSKSSEAIAEAPNQPPRPVGVSPPTDLTQEEALAKKHYETLAAKLKKTEETTLMEPRVFFVGMGQQTGLELMFFFF